VTGALDFGAVEIDFAVGQAELFVATAVVEYVHRVIDTHGHEDATSDVQLTWHA
jgi:hypothetical protein